MCLPLFSVYTATTARSLKLPRPRRSQFTPNENHRIEADNNIGNVVRKSKSSLQPYDEAVSKG
jgi:hypothetical protein